MSYARWWMLDDPSVMVTDNVDHDGVHNRNDDAADVDVYVATADADGCWMLAA